MDVLTDKDSKLFGWKFTNWWIGLQKEEFVAILVKYREIGKEAAASHWEEFNSNRILWIKCFHNYETLYYHFNYLVAKGVFHV